jgi:2-dehydro-3-deoxygluconokinase
MKIPLKQKAYNYVLDKIISGDLNPGQQMSEVAMAQEIGISPTPLRESISATHNNWGAILYDVTTEKAVFLPMNGDRYHPYEIRNIIDRVGGGDSFAAGLVFALTTPELSEAKNAIAFAASCLAHSVVGDVNYSTRKEVESLMGGSSSGRVNR